MADYSSQWRVSAALEYTVPIGAHVAEFSKAYTAMTQELESEGITADIFLYADEDFIYLRAEVGDITSGSQPSLQWDDGKGVKVGNL